MNKPRAAVDIDMLTMALQARGNDGCWWLDTQNGDVLFGKKEECPAEDNIQYINIRPLDAEIISALMESFIATLDETACREKLQATLEQQQTHWHFKQVLAEHPAEEDDWYAFKEQFYALQARQWLRDRGLQYHQIKEERLPAMTDDISETGQAILLSLTLRSTPARRYVLWQTAGDLESMTLTAYENETDVLAEMTINTHQYQGIERLLKPSATLGQRQGQTDGIPVCLEYTMENGQSCFEGTMLAGDWLDQLQTTLGLILALPVIHSQG